jgi:hypothetical protein
MGSEIITCHMRWLLAEEIENGNELLEWPKKILG